jgi:hypothetical protein
MAADGPAVGMMSVDIGVSESGTTPIDQPLQLIGSGQSYEDFGWAAPQANTSAAINTGQAFTGGEATAVLVINEVDYDQPSTDTAEFIEIKNIGTAIAGLNDYTLELVNGTGGGADVYAQIVLSPATLPPGGYFVVCGNAANVANCNLDTTPDTNLVQNGAPDAIGLRLNGELIDVISYEGDTGAPTRRVPGPVWKISVTAVSAAVPMATIQTKTLMISRSQHLFLLEHLTSVAPPVAYAEILRPSSTTHRGPALQARFKATRFPSKASLWAISRMVRRDLTAIWMVSISRRRTSMPMPIRTPPTGYSFPTARYPRWMCTSATGCAFRAQLLSCQD